MKRKNNLTSFIVIFLGVMIIGSLNGFKSDSTTAETEVTLEETAAPSKEMDLPDDIPQTTASVKELTSQSEKSADQRAESDRIEGSILKEIETSEDSEIRAETTLSVQQDKSLCGTYELSFGSDGSAELEITYSPEEDLYAAVFNGSIGADAGGTEGFLSAYTDGTDNIWEYCDNNEFDSGNSSPSFRLEYDGTNSIAVTSLDCQTFGGMQFPGFEGIYLRTAEYPMP